MNFGQINEPSKWLPYNSSIGPWRPKVGVVYHLPNLIADRQEQPNSNLQKSEILSMGSLLKSNLHIKESIDVRQRQFACRAALEAADGRQTPDRISREIAAGAIHCFPMPLAVAAELGSAASGSNGQRRARAGGSLAPVGHWIDRHIHTIEYIALACTTVDSTRSALLLTVPYNLTSPSRST